MDNTITSLNTTQSVFVVFYAIFWGAVFNVQPKWKGFQFPLCFTYWHVARRVMLSILLLNVAPVAFFGLGIFALNKYPFRPDASAQLALHDVIPAFAIFGFYRAWLGIVELRPKWFYKEFPADVREEYRNNEPTIAQFWYPEHRQQDGSGFTVTPIKTGPANLAAAGVYFCIATWFLNC